MGKRKVLANMRDAYREYSRQGLAKGQADVAHRFTKSPSGGGIGYVSSACKDDGYNVGLSSLTGGYRFQDKNKDNVQDSTPFNRDLIVTVHEMGHNMGSGHTFDTSAYNPPIDQCVTASGTRNSGRLCVRGTLMSYCHLCTPPWG